MNVNKLLVLGLLLFAQTVAAQGFDNSSLSGCYVFSFSGNVLGPRISVYPETGELYSETGELMLHCKKRIHCEERIEERIWHAYSSVGRVCADGEGTLTEISGTENFGGLCAVSFEREVDTENSYIVFSDGTGAATASVRITADSLIAVPLPTSVPAGDSPIPAGCAALGVEVGDTQTFDFSLAVEAEQGCFKVNATNATTPAGPLPIVTAGEVCPQVTQVTPALGIPGVEPGIPGVEPGIPGEEPDGEPGFVPPPDVPEIR